VGEERELGREGTGVEERRVLGILALYDVLAKGKRS